MNKELRDTIIFEYTSEITQRMFNNSSQGIGKDF